MNHDANDQDPRRDGEPTPGLASAAADDLASLLDAATDTVDRAPAPAPPPRRGSRFSFAGVLFGVGIVGVIGAVGWWSWQMADMGAQRLRSADVAPGDTPAHAPAHPTSPWLSATADTIPTDGQTFALEAAFAASADRLAVAFSNGRMSVYPIIDAKFADPEPIDAVGPYPLALRYDADDPIELIRQDGRWLDRLSRGNLQTTELEPPVAEVFYWDRSLRVTAPRPFDGGLRVDRERGQTQLPAQKFLGVAPALGVVLTSDRDDRTRVGILEPERTEPRFVTAPGVVVSASISPGGEQLALVMSDGAIACIDATSGEVRWRRDPAPGIERPRLAFLPTGEIVLAEYRLLLLDASEGQVLGDITPDSDLPLATFDLLVCPDGRRLCVLGNDLHLITRGK